MKKLVPHFIAKHFAAEHNDDLVLLPTIKFYLEAAYHGDHGEIVVTNHALGLKEKAVRFVFVGRQEPPALDLVTMKELWKQAMEQGYIPHQIVRYGLPNPAEMIDHALAAAAKEAEELNKPIPATQRAQHRDPNARLDPAAPNHDAEVSGRMPYAEKLVGRIMEIDKMARPADSATQDQDVALVSASRYLKHLKHRETEAPAVLRSQRSAAN